jgi:fatty acid-binding protein DegV
MERRAYDFEIVADATLSVSQTIKRDKGVDFATFRIRSDGAVSPGRV